MICLLILGCTIFACYDDEDAGIWLQETEDDEEEMPASRGALHGSIVGFWRVVISWAAGEVPEGLSLERVELLKRVFHFMI